MRTVISTQCAGVVGATLLSNGFMLAVLADFGYSDSAILTVLALPQILMLAGNLPAAYFSDQLGKKRLGQIGIWLRMFAFAILAIIAGTGDAMAPLLCVGIIILGCGNCLFVASWFGLLQPIIPASERGRFFAKLRMSWQSVALVFSLILSGLLAAYPGRGTFRIILGFTVFALVLHLWLYRRIPEVELPATGSRTPLRQALRNILAIRGYLIFAAYGFLITLVTAATPILLNLIEKETLGFSDAMLVMMGNITFGGAILGFLVGGRLVDRLGAWRVFVLCQFSFALVLLAIIGRQSANSALTMGILHAGFGFVAAAFSIALTDRTMALAGDGQKSLSTSMLNATRCGGVALASLIAAAILKHKLLPSSWQLGGQSFTAHDSLIILAGITTLLGIVGLPLLREHSV
ncbi:MAG: MFS family permease [Rhodothermales bacterium]|jgi:MFS family permease